MAADVPAYASTYEDDRAFYSSQESFKLHLEKKMDYKQLAHFRGVLKRELTRLREKQFQRQNTLHYANSIAHCRLLGTGGTYSSAPHDLTQWKRGPAFFGTPTGSLAQTLAIARGISIRFWVCKRYSIEVIGPPEHYSSQECPYCLNSKKCGSERRFKCGNCGNDTHRDICKATNNQSQRVIAMGRDGRRALFPGDVAVTTNSNTGVPGPMLRGLAEEG